MKRSHTEDDERAPPRAWLAPLTREFMWAHHEHCAARRGVPGQAAVKTLAFAITEPLEDRLLRLHFNLLLTRPPRDERKDIPDFRNVCSASSDSRVSSESSDSMDVVVDGDDDDIAPSAPLSRSELRALRRASRAELIEEHAVGGFLLFSIYEAVPPLLDALEAARLQFLADGRVEGVLAVVLWAMGEVDNFPAFPWTLRDTPYARVPEHLGGARVPYSIALRTVDEGLLAEDNCTLYVTRPT